MATARLVTAETHDGASEDVLCLTDAAQAAYRVGTLPLTEGEYTFSLWMRAESLMPVGLVILGARETAVATTEWQRFTWTVEEASGQAIDIQPGTNAGLYLHRAMLEAGGRASDWQPAPEDFEASIESLQAALGSEIDLTRDQIALRVRAEDLEMSLRVREDGVHIGRLGDFYEARISGESFDIMAGSQAVASFQDGLIVIGGWAFQVTADGGLSQSRYEGGKA